MKKMNRRTFAQQAATVTATAAALFLPLADAAQFQPASPATNLKEKAISQQDEAVKALRAKALPYDLEPAFVFAAKPRPVTRRKP